MSFLASLHNTEFLALARQKAADEAFDAWFALLEKEAEILGTEARDAFRLLCRHLYEYSPFLSHIVMRQPRWILALDRLSVEEATIEIIETVRAIDTKDETSCMRKLRLAKQHIALLAGCADISAIWNVSQVTRVLSDFADAAIQAAFQHAYDNAQNKGEFADEAHEVAGLFVLSMGKLGANELNYSSDIDLIIAYDPERVGYTGRKNAQHACNKLTQHLVSLLQDRTADGYVFRVDLRLRPDPLSTPLAVSTHAALTYYETVGQNWERSAMIKARIVAGDKVAAERYLKALHPFIWRRHLDFAAIADIQSVRRQMYTDKELPESLLGHDIKTGIGGIREIELLASIEQLIWGGKMPDLRVAATIDALYALANRTIISMEVAQMLEAHYYFLRDVEHALQMQEDQQTHAIPASQEAFERLAGFMQIDAEALHQRLHSTLSSVHQLYNSMFKDAPPLSAGGNLVFTGVDHDPETLQNLTEMGYDRPRIISDTVMGWHRGSRRSTRSKRARELLTELMPRILMELGTTVKPDAAFSRFDDFLAKLPVGVQLFSLISAKPHMMGLIAQIMGSAPALAELLGKYPQRLEAVLQADFFTELPSAGTMQRELEDILIHARDTEEALDMLRVYKGEKQFQVGVQLLRRAIQPTEANHFLSDLAEVIIRSSVDRITHDFVGDYGTITGGAHAIVAMGRLGARELTFGSDIDIVYLYTADDPQALSSGPRQYDARVYYTRLCQRIITALTSLSRHGQMYEVDMRLRPSGNDSPLAISVQALEKYLTESAWTFELMALTRARFVMCNGIELKEEITRVVNTALTKTRDNKTVRTDVVSMNQRIHAEYGGAHPWDIKYAFGGLIDGDFIAQYLMLAHGNEHTTLIRSDIQASLAFAAEHRLLTTEQYEQLCTARTLQINILSILRLCANAPMTSRSAPAGLKRLLCIFFDTESIHQLELQLVEAQQEVRRIFDDLLPH